ncbi:MAG TPA: thioesterase family protein [Solimonas sp.]|nr:thioesterase family protein [Solimonas sp.]
MLLSEILRSMTGQGGEWSAQVPEDWQQGRTLFGGLQAALAVRAMRGLVPPGVPLRSLQVTFVAPVPAGTVRVEARLLRTGKSALHAQAQIMDGAQVACLAVAVFGAARESSLSIAPPPVRADVGPQDAREFPYVRGFTPEFTRHVRMRWARGGFPFSGQAEPRTQIYVQMRDEPVVDEYQLIALADVIPSPGLSMFRKAAMASSMTWTLDILRDRYDADPAGAWWIDAEVTSGRDGYLAQTATLWSGAGEAVALSRQGVVVFG